MTAVRGPTNINISDVRGDAYVESTVKDAQTLLDQLNGGNIRDGNGVLQKFDTLEQWETFLKSPGPKFGGTPPAQLNTEALNGYKESITNALKNIQDAVNVIKGGANPARNAEVRDMLESMKKLLENGDILAAVSLLNVTQVKVLDQQLSGRVMSMQQRNAQVKVLNDRLADQQGAVTNGTPTGAQQKEITRLKGEVDKLNGDSQLDMIQIQSLTTKRNQAFEMLSNLTSKLQSSMGTIIGNMRG